MKRKMVTGLVLILVFCLIGRGTEAGVNRKITDLSGQAIEVPAIEATNHLVIIAPPLFSIYYALDQDLDKVVGLHPMVLDAAKKTVLLELEPKLATINNDFIRGFNVNTEEFLNLQPDIGLYWGKAQGKVFQTINIPGIDFQSYETYDALKALQDWLKLMAELIGNQEKAEEIIAYGEDSLSIVRERIGQIAEAEKKTGLMIFSNTQGKIIVTGSGFYGDYWLRESGLANVATDLKNNVEVNLEQIYQWNPDIIYVFIGSAEAMLANSIDGQDWSGLKAFQTERIYQIPNGMFEWYSPCSDSPLMLRWMALQSYPDKFKDFNLKEDILHYYQMIYGHDLTASQINTILN